ncbi:MAG: hypothetical protein Q9M91_06940 [Candidatus Dojkabacteria bacterium]|nr:hypothetical protein [Candidatus Dojkabacteria bacterium]
MTKKQMITIWDIDKTLYSGYVIIDSGKYLESIGVFKNDFSKRIDTAQPSYKRGEVDYDEFAKTVYMIYGDNIFNKNQFEILQLSKIFWDKSFSKIYKASYQLYNYLNVLGSDHAAISGSSFESLYYLLGRLSFSKMKSTEYETIDGNYTKKLVSTLVSHSDKSNLHGRVLNQKNKYQVLVGVGDNYAGFGFFRVSRLSNYYGVQ